MAISCQTLPATEALNNEALLFFQMPRMIFPILMNTNPINLVPNNIHFSSFSTRYRYGQKYLVIRTSFSGQIQGQQALKKV